MKEIIYYFTKLLMSVSVVFIIGCAKDQEPLKRNQSIAVEDAEFYSYGTSQYMNSNNSLDSIGFYHNYIMDSVLQNSLPEGLPEIEVFLKSGVKGIFIHMYPQNQSDTFNSALLNLIENYEGLYGEIDFETDYEDVILNLGLTSQEENVILDYLSKVVDLLDTMQLGSSISTINNRFIDIENDFINFGYNTVFYETAFAICRYSFLLGWDPEEDIEIEYVNARRKKKKAVIIADVVGGIIGGVASGGNALAVLGGAATASSIVKTVQDTE